jgi:2-methylaconitate cis-trans-isomerase PrpF
MSDPVQLRLPAEEAYRALAPEVARKYLEITGGSSTDAAALAESVSAAVAALAGGAAPEADLTLAFEHDTGSLEVRVRCGDRSTTVTQLLPARKS